MSTLSESSQDSVGWIYPEQPTVSAASTQPVFVANSVSGTMQLIEGQDYIDVVFPTVQPNTGWTFLEAQVVNTTDVLPLNITGGIVTRRTRAGFRLYFNGAPDTDSYYLFWKIVTSDPDVTAADEYLLVGPSAGPINEASTFSVSLPSNTSITDVVTVIPDDDGAGGTFLPSSVQLTPTAPTATFTYTPVSYGTKTISVINDGSLADPPSQPFLSAVATYLLSGPSTAYIGDPSSPFTVELPVGGSIAGAAVVVTPTDQVDDSVIEGIFTPSIVTLTNASPSATFTYTPDPASGSTKTIRTINNGGLDNPTGIVVGITFNPASLTGLVGWWKADSLFALSDGDPISTWPDSSSEGNDATQAGSARPVYKTSIINSQAAVRFDDASVQQSFVLDAQIPTGVATWTVFIVQKPFNASSTMCGLGAAGGAASDAAVVQSAFVGQPTFGAQGFAYAYLADTSGAWHVYAVNSNAQMWMDGVSRSLSGGAGIIQSNYGLIGYTTPMLGARSNGYIAEILIYDTVLSGGDRSSVETYLQTKYGL